ncbi:hypothetical protein VTL71DRAFT_5370 [Oculimacula yallundae]|uniref:Zn(2)-C6 fungal-type domain-containing protein n=1 Tax=Oculimacula yallundae TaxID=86028 RepID=A0ABR4C1I9_9HELO
MASQRQAILSCSACKSQKRKCDRRLPICSLCTRKDRVCEYPSPRRRKVSHQSQSRGRTYPSPQLSAATSTSAISTPATPNPLANNTVPRLTQAASQFPAVFYLDNSVFYDSLIAKPSSVTSIPSEVSSSIGDAPNQGLIATEYFKTVHSWMPIVSKKRFYENVPRSDADTSPPAFENVPKSGANMTPLRSDYALLILCMKLSMWTPHEEDPRTPEYLAAKTFYLDLEIHGIVSVQVLQALILIALYEAGHAIFPSAAVSKEACVRYGQALGINWESKSPRKKPFAWVDREEENRVWWAVFMLECVSRVGYPKDSPLLEVPSPDVRLPSDTSAWDEGVMPSKNLTILQPRSNQDLGPFASMAEATRLLSRVLEHVSGNNGDERLHDEEGLLFDHALKALENVVQYEGDYNTLSIMNQTTMCSISLIILHEAHASKQTTSSEYYQTIHRAKGITHALRRSQEEFTRSLTDVAPIHSCIRDASPFITTLLYQTAIANLRMYQETGTEESSEALQMVKGSLKHFDSRWKASGAYLNILEAREVATM